MMQLYQLLEVLHTGAYPVDFYHASYGSTGSLTINGDGSDVSQGATISINLLSQMH